MSKLYYVTTGGKRYVIKVWKVLRGLMIIGLIAGFLAAKVSAGSKPYQIYYENIGKQVYLVAVLNNHRGIGICKK